ncbi:MAG: MFS transporter [Chloroflexi bacterium]|nr:MFS transporter [Chloroflexota bacterium]
MSKRTRSPVIFFGWLTVLAGGFISLWGQGYAFSGFSALFKPISSELGFSRAVASVPSAIARLEGGIDGPVTGWASDRFGARWIVLAGVFLIGLGLVLMYFIDSLWAFYLVWGLILGMGINVGTGTPLNKAIADWFVRKRGFALSIKMALQGAGGVLVLPLIAWLIATQGWRMTCLIGGIVMLVAGLPLAWFSVKQHRPEHYGLLPDGAKSNNDTVKTDDMINRGITYAAEVEEIEFTLRQAIKTPAFWLLIIALSFREPSSSPLNIHIIPFLTDTGIEPLKAAGMMTTIYAASIPARIIAGFLADRVTKKYLRFLFAAILLLQAAGFFIFLSNQTETMIYFWFVLHGFGFGASIGLTTAIRARYFGRKAFGSINGFASFFMTPVGMAAPILIGWVYDTAGSYIAAFTVIAVLIAFAGVLITLASPPKPPARISDVREIV